MARGIIYENEAYEDNGYGACEWLVDITKDFIITCFTCNVLDPILHIYNRYTFEEIGGQDLFKSMSLSSNMPKDVFHSYGCVDIEIDGNVVGTLGGYLPFETDESEE